MIRRKKSSGYLNPTDPLYPPPSPTVNKSVTQVKNSQSSHVWRIRTNSSHAWQICEFESRTNLSQVWQIRTYLSHLWRVHANSSDVWIIRASSSQVWLISTRDVRQIHHKRVFVIRSYMSVLGRCDIKKNQRWPNFCRYREEHYRVEHCDQV